MEIKQTGTEGTLYRNGEQIGQYTLQDTPGTGPVITKFEIRQDCRHKGYGTYMLRQLLHALEGYSQTPVYARVQGDTAQFLKKAGFEQQGDLLCFYRAPQFSPLMAVHQLLCWVVRPGDFVIDATAGRGRDTAFLCRLVGNSGRVLAMDIQPQAVDATRQYVRQQGFEKMVRVVCDSHQNLLRYAAPASAGAVVFNFGYLPGGDHSIFSRGETSVLAIEQALQIVRPGGAVILCLYAGQSNGFEEREQILQFVSTLDTNRYTVVGLTFLNRKTTSPMPVLILREK